MKPVNEFPQGTYMEGHVRYLDGVPYIMHLYSLSLLREEIELHRKRKQWDIVEWMENRIKYLEMTDLLTRGDVCVVFPEKTNS